MVAYLVDFVSPVMEATRLRLFKRFGTVVDQWWRDLPGRVATLSRRWSLVIEEPVGRGNTSLVIRCTRSDGHPAILKLVPDRHVAATESCALMAWQPSGRVPVLFETDFGEGALLMEAILGETSVADAGVPIPLADFGDLCRDLHITNFPDHTGKFESLGQRVDFMFSRCADRLAGISELKPSVSSADLERSHRLARKLTDDTPAAVLLHGDLHPGNILLARPNRGLVAIDPRPCLGDGAFDAIDFVFWPEASASEWSRRRDQLALHMECDAKRLWDWCSSVAVVIAVGKLAKGEPNGAVASLMELAP